MAKERKTRTSRKAEEETTTVGEQTPVESKSKLAGLRSMFTGKNAKMLAGIAVVGGLFYFGAFAFALNVAAQASILTLALTAAGIAAVAAVAYKFGPKLTDAAKKVPGAVAGGAAKIKGAFSKKDVTVENNNTINPEDESVITLGSNEQAPNSPSSPVKPCCRKDNAANDDATAEAALEVGQAQVTPIQDASKKKKKHKSQVVDSPELEKSPKKKKKKQQA